METDKLSGAVQAQETTVKSVEPEVITGVV